MDRSLGALVLSSLILAAGCGGSTGPDVAPLTPEIAERVAAPVAGAIFAAAAGHEGTSFFDNFLPFPRRGIARYVATSTGKSVTFSGCDLGGGIVLDGTGNVDWAGPGLAPTRDRFCTDLSCLSAYRWRGSLTVTLDGQTTVGIQGVEAADIATSAPYGVLPFPVSATVTLGGIEVAVADSTFYRGIFDPGGLTIESLPNPGNSLAALTHADLERLAYDPGIRLVYTLVNEMSELRADHTHEYDCGTSAVTFDPDGYAQVAAAWSSCSWGGTFVSGEFIFEFDRAGTDFNAPRLLMTVNGDLTLGGGIPTVRLSQLTWRASFPDGFPGTMALTMDLVGASGDRRTFTQTVKVDD